MQNLFAHFIRFCYLIIIINLGHFSTAIALSTDREQPIQITADQGMIDDAKGLAVYEGNVVIKQGTIEILAAKVTLSYTQTQSIDRVVAEGQPAHFKQTPDGNKPDIKAKSTKMEYNSSESTLVLTGEAELSQGQDISTAPRISYNTREGVIRADRGQDQKGERITVTIQPTDRESKNPPRN